MSTNLPVRCLLWLQVWTFRSVPIKPDLRRGTICQIFTFLLLSIKHALVPSLMTQLSSCTYVGLLQALAAVTLQLLWLSSPSFMPLVIWIPSWVDEIKMQFVWPDENVFLGMKRRNPRALPAVSKQLLPLYNTAKGACENVAHSC